jgi:hypothetical protein
MASSLPLAGTEVLHRLQLALEDAERRVQRAHAEHDTLGRQLKDALTRRSERFQDLARAQLPALAPPHLAELCETARARVMAVYERHALARDQVDQQLAGMAQIIATAEATWRGTQTQVDELTQQRTQIEQQIAQRLADDPEFRSASEAALAAEQELQRNEERFHELQQESQAKLPAFERSSLFQYLYRRGYRQSAIVGRTLTGQLDRWVAGLIDYPKAVRSYEFLRLTPPRMQQELQLRQRRFDEMMDAVEAARDKAADEAGLRPLVDRLTKLEAETQQQHAQWQQLHQQQQALREESQLMAAGLGRFHTEALNQLKDILSQTQSEVLEQTARRTSTVADDRLVAEIVGLTEDLNRMQPRVLANDQQQQAAETSREEIASTIRRFKSNEWAIPAASFQASLNVDELVAGLLSGQVDRNQASQRLQRSVRIEPSAWERTAETTIQVLTSPQSRVLADALVQVAGTVLQASVSRSMERRTGSHADWGSTFGGSSGRSGSSSSGGGGSFSSGAGF